MSGSAFKVVFMQFVALVIVGYVITSWLLASSASFPTVQSKFSDVESKFGPPSPKTEDANRARNLDTERVWDSIAKSAAQFHRSGGDPKFAMATFGGRMMLGSPQAEMMQYCTSEVISAKNKNEEERPRASENSIQSGFVSGRHKDVVAFLNCHAAKKVERLCDAAQRADLVNFYAFYEHTKARNLAADQPFFADLHPNWDGPEDVEAFENLKNLIETGYLSAADFGPNSGPQVKQALRDAQQPKTRKCG
ncbi:MULTISPECIES: hypothetical protein [unclassified Beijerinckia]|uniref:hypothetical protein n=1 Tax=unclassified Beijerinckia TaxID=2638183 RepID=UPI00089A59C7|nr:MULTISPECIES: hypothetical protein [unclassified Beijerinckia]MDH7794304.1 hypothetical protein [Beijerinckia sp. GAS462]SEB58306.1 hypothetical protein SAMN05443249_0573 [Beijerinckia sp. 28-YEA-48]